jgi:hypothetical protein
MDIKTLKKELSYYSTKQEDDASLPFPRRVFDSCCRYGASCERVSTRTI